MHNKCILTPDRLTSAAKTTVYYDIPGSSLDFFPKLTNCTILFQNISTFQIEFSIESGQVMGIDGYWPHKNWRLCDLEPPVCEEHGLRAFFFGDDPLPGVAYSLAQNLHPDTWFDPGNGWICIGSTKTCSEHSVRFATDTIVVFMGEQVVSFWIRPINWEDLVSLQRVS